MTVRELIERLSVIDPEIEVTAQWHEDSGYLGVRSVCVMFGNKEGDDYELDLDGEHTVIEAMIVLDY